MDLSLDELFSGVAHLDECAQCMAEIDGIECGKPVVHWWFGEHIISPKTWLRGFCECHRTWCVQSNSMARWKQISYEEAVICHVMKT